MELTIGQKDFIEKIYDEVRKDYDDIDEICEEVVDICVDNEGLFDLSFDDEGDMYMELSNAVYEYLQSK